MVNSGVEALQTTKIIGRHCETVCDFDKAFLEYRIAINLDRSSFEAHFRLAVMLKQYGDFAASTDEFEMALPLASDSFWQFLTEDQLEDVGIIKTIVDPETGIISRP